MCMFVMSRDPYDTLLQFLDLFITSTRQVSDRYPTGIRQYPTWHPTQSDPMRNQSQSSIITPLSCPIKDASSCYYVPSVQSEGRYMYDVVYVRTPLDRVKKVKKLEENLVLS